MAVKTDESSHARVVITACMVVPVTSLVFLALRLWTKIFVSRAVGRDDCKKLSSNS